MTRRVFSPPESAPLASGGAIEYQLDGTVGVEAGRLGTPTFGPMLLTSGQLRPSR